MARPSGSEKKWIQAAKYRHRKENTDTNAKNSPPVRTHPPNEVSRSKQSTCRR